MRDDGTSNARLLPEWHTRTPHYIITPITTYHSLLPHLGTQVVPALRGERCNNPPTSNSDPYPSKQRHHHRTYDRQAGSRAVHAQRVGRGRRGGDDRGGGARCNDGFYVVLVGLCLSPSLPVGYRTAQMTKMTTMKKRTKRSRGRRRRMGRSGEDEESSRKRA